MTISTIEDLEAYQDSIVHFRMDAKPQRPVRSVRVRGDENFAPTLTANKTIHQRNKSTPALSTMAGTTGVRAAAKRTAFGDVSNTSNAARSSKDDSVVSVKLVAENSEKEVQGQLKAAPLLRGPAQRPLSVSSSLKGFLGNVTTIGLVDNAAPKNSVANANGSQPPNSRKTLTKQKATVFKDSVLPSVPEQAVKPPKEIRANSKVAQAHQTHGPRVSIPEPTSIPAPTQSDSTLPEVHTSDDLVLESQNPVKATPTEERSSLARSDGIFVDSNGNIQIYQDVPSPKKEPVVSVAQAESNPSAQTRPAPTDHPCQDKVECRDIPSDHSVPHHEAAQPSEPEEYWDDEEDENYDEEGYVTARSYRSVGGNTTGGATTVLFPIMNQKIKREIAAAKILVEGSLTAEEIEDDYWDTSMVAEYGDEIFQYMRDLELKMLPNAHYMENQAEIQWSMRSVLMDWLVQVHHRFSLLPETLFLCVNYVDRFLSCKIVSLGKLQLVGATAIFIAAKYEEINCPSVQEIVYMVDGGYTMDEILKAERFMLSMLQFELGWPGPMSFLRRISKADDYDLETRTLAKYFLEVTIMDERFVGSPPSYAAAGAHCLARLMLKKGYWTPAHVYYSNYTYTQLLPIVTLILECCDNPQKHHAAVFEKYCDKRFKKASIFAQSEVRSTREYLQMERDLALHRQLH